jgi:hypothetical protein
VGDAVCDDATLKDADEMSWPNSPTDIERTQIDFLQWNEAAFQEYHDELERSNLSSIVFF